MVSKEIALEVAAFLDSPWARALALPKNDVRKVAEEFVAICYEELGKKPRLLDGQDVHEVLGHALPSRFAPKDPVAEHVPAVLAAYFAHLEATQVVTGAFEIRRALAEREDEFLAAVRTGKHADHQVRRQTAPFVHGASKLGRNDPCSCGSGKKFKKCHGKNE